MHKSFYMEKYANKNTKLLSALNAERNRMEKDKLINIMGTINPVVRRQLQRELNKWVHAGRPLVFSN